MGHRHFRFSVLPPNMARYYGLQTGAAEAAVLSECCADRFFDATLIERRPWGKGRPRPAGTARRPPMSRLGRREQPVTGSAG